MLTFFILVLFTLFCCSTGEFLVVHFGAEDDAENLRCRWWGWYGPGLSKGFYPTGPYKQWMIEEGSKPCERGIVADR